MEIIDLDKRNIDVILKKRESLQLVLKSEYRKVPVAACIEKIFECLDLRALTSIHVCLIKERERLEDMDNLPFGYSDEVIEKDVQLEYIKRLIENSLIEKAWKELKIIDKFLQDINYVPND